MTVLRNPRSVSPEIFFAIGIVLNVAIAFIVTHVPAFGLSGFLEIAAILIGADVVLYALTKARIIRPPGAGKQ